MHECDLVSRCAVAHVHTCVCLHVSKCDVKDDALAHMPSLKLLWNEGSLTI
jgi:hypothetical protein